MKKKKDSIRLDYTLTFYIMLGILIVLIASSLTITTINAINENLFDQNGTLITFLIIGLGITLIVSIVLSYVFKRIINKYIASIRSNLHSVASGNFNIRLKENKNKYLNDIVHDFNQMVKELSSVQMLRNDFISNFSHEFKTPLASIKGFAEVLQSKDNLSKTEKNEYLQIIIDECSRLSTLANNTLLISKLDTQSKLTNTEKVYLDEQIDQCLFMLEKRIQEKNINIITNLPQTTFICDKNLMQQVWINILDNAIKFTKNEISISIESNEKHIIISIKDNGIGIPRESINHIFDKFFQADTSHSKDGCGLGLATANKIINLHGGKIEVDSKENMYTTFIIKLKNT